MRVKKSKRESPWVYIVAFALAGGFTVAELAMVDSLDNMATRITSLARITEAQKRNYRLPDAEWAGMYQEYNRDYFGGQLPRATVMSSDGIGTDVFAVTIGTADSPVIEMNALTLYGEKEARIALLHEMVHIKLHQGHTHIQQQEGVIIIDGNDEHGEQFMKELHRLITLGAFDDLIG